jgi:uncharacterized membrane protein
MMILAAIAGVVVAWLITVISQVTGNDHWPILVAGGAVGALFVKMARLQARVSLMERGIRATGMREPGEPSLRDTEREKPAPEHFHPAPEDAAAATLDADRRPAPAATRMTPGWVERARAVLNRWLFDGNVPVKIGVLVSFIGIAALLRFGVEQGWFNAPIEVRLLSVAAIAIAALVFAWRQRQSRRLFALAVQGGAIGILLLTVFSAFSLYDVLPATAAFALLVVLVAGVGVLAVVQNALALAVLALIAGFAAPVLVSTGEGSHIALFSWYALLNLCIFAVAWHKSWMLLNRLGFAFTFIISAVWGVLSYVPAHYVSAQAFLLFFFALYLMVPVLVASRTPGERNLDVMLVFGLPLFAFPQQIGLLEGEQVPVAGAALVGGLIYSATAWLLIRRQLVSLGKAHAVLAVGFATLAVPFAFSGSSITLIWALEGAALVWFGVYWQSRWTRRAGLGLQGLAALVWLFSVLTAGHGEWPVLNDVFLGGLALAAASAVSAWRYDDLGARRLTINLLAGASLAAWSLAGIVEIESALRYAWFSDGLLALAAMTALMSAFVHRARPWWITGAAPAAALANGIWLALFQCQTHVWPFGGLGFPAWGIFLISAWLVQLLQRNTDNVWRGLSSLAIHAAVVTALAATLYHLAAVVLDLGEGWQWLSAGLPLLALCALLLKGGRPPLSPRVLPGRQHAWLAATTAIAVALGLIMSLPVEGNPAPLVFVPVLNPLELGQLTAMLMLVWVCVRYAAVKRTLQLSVVGGIAFVLITIMALRAVHYLAAIAWSPDALLNAPIGQMTLSLTWTTIGVIAWLLASQRGSRTLWYVGAALLGVVLAKLILVDRSYLSNVAGIISFLAFGLLSIVVGYFAPAPPRPGPPVTDDEGVQT